MRKFYREKKQYTYKCTLTGEEFVMTKECKTPEELVSVKGYYQLRPDADDRPEAVKKQETLDEVKAPSAEVVK